MVSCTAKCEQLPLQDRPMFRLARQLPFVVLLKGHRTVHHLQARLIGLNWYQRVFGDPAELRPLAVHHAIVQAAAATADLLDLRANAEELLVLRRQDAPAAEHLHAGCLWVAYDRPPLSILRRPLLNPCALQVVVVDLHDVGGPASAANFHGSLEVNAYRFVRVSTRVGEPPAPHQCLAPFLCLLDGHRLNQQVVAGTEIPFALFEGDLLIHHGLFQDH
mmetsp:Transcript_69879/g.204516  ORF Transcript_69879/g.204516 Transcript_69879/m.204516 type:complete len:219 (-) Transcript_69879:909-1565(-)